MSGSIPSVSVLLPVRDGARYVVEAVASILAQTLTDLELVVVDNGSTDGTVERLRGIEDPRLRLLEEPEPGIVPALNRGLAACRASYVARMDADDVALPRRLEIQAAYLDAHPDVVLVAANAEWIDAAGAATGRVSAFHRPMRRPLETGYTPLIHPTVMFRRAAVEAVGGYDSAYLHAEDYELWLRLRERGRLVCLPDVLLRFRKHGGNVSADERSMESILTALLAWRLSERHGVTREVAARAARPVAREFTERVWRRRRAALSELGEAVERRRWSAVRPRMLPAALCRLQGRGALWPWEIRRLERRALGGAGVA